MIRDFPSEYGEVEPIGREDCLGKEEDSELTRSSIG